MQYPQQYPDYYQQRPQIQPVKEKPPFYKSPVIIISIIMILVFAVLGVIILSYDEESAKESRGESLDIKIEEPYYTDYLMSEYGSVSVPAKSNQFFVMTIIITNNDDVGASINPNYFTLVDTESHVYRYDLGSYSLPDAMTNTELEPDMVYSSSIVFEIPTLSAPSKLIFNNMYMRKEISLTSEIIQTKFNRAPNADPGPDLAVYLGDAVEFDGSGSTDPEGMELEYEWEFGDGEKHYPYTGLSSHKYSDLGTYTAFLTVTDPCGAENSDSIEVEVYNTAPTADAGPDQTVYISMSLLSAKVDFDAGQSSDPDGRETVEEYFWDFGDGGTDDTSLRATSHTYLEAGVYDVELTVTDEYGKTDEDNIQITVLLPFELTIEDHGRYDATDPLDYHYGDYYVDVNLKNIGNEIEDVYSTFFELVASDGVGYAWDGEEGNPPESLAPGASSSWRVYFDLPEGKGVEKIVYDEVIEREF
jgi:PKD repeat protein